MEQSTGTPFLCIIDSVRGLSSVCRPFSALIVRRGKEKAWSLGLEAMIPIKDEEAEICLLWTPLGLAD